MESAGVDGRSASKLIDSYTHLTVHSKWTLYQVARAKPLSDRQGGITSTRSLKNVLHPYEPKVVITKVGL